MNKWKEEEKVKRLKEKVLQSSKEKRVIEPKADLGYAKRDSGKVEDLYPSLERD